MGGGRAGEVSALSGHPLFSAAGDKLASEKHITTTNFADERVQKRGRVLLGYPCLWGAALFLLGCLAGFERAHQPPAPFGT
jgi:hypothetical protein